jgi:predicted dinucleotide-binding enzyme
MKPKIAIIGKGNVGSALKRGLERAGYAVRSTGKEEVKETATWGEVVIIAVPFMAIDAVVQQLGNAIEKKVVVDVTNALDAEMQLALGFSTSGGEELQKKAPNARIVKAFNTVFAQHMDTGRVLDQKLTLFAVSDDQEARSIVLDMGRALGFDAVDAGPLSNARQLESLGYFNIQLGYVLGNGTNAGFKFIH